MRALRIAGWVVLAIVVLLVGGAGVFVATFDTQAAVARMAAQVRRATGRELTVAGPVRVPFAWPLEVVAQSVSLSNPPGASRPAMVTVPEIRARLALGRLLSGHADLDVLLVRPDVQFENGNWNVHPEPPLSAAPGGSSRPPPVSVEVRRVRVEDGRLALRGMGNDLDVAVPAASVTVGDDGVAVSGRLAGSGGTADVAGTAGPHGLPVHAHADITQGDGPFRLSSLDLDAPAADVPAHLKAALAVRGLPVAADFAVRPDQAGAGKALPFTLAVAAAGATLTAEGSVAGPGAAGGAGVTVSARIPDLPALSPLAGTALPAVGAVSFDGRVIGRDGFRSGVAVRSMRLAAAPGDVSGDVALGWAGRPSLRGTLSSSRLDIDALMAALPHPAAPPAQPGPAAPAPPPAPARLIPDRPLPMTALDTADADLQLSAANVVVGQVKGALDGHIAADHGRVRLDPLAVTLPGGRVTGSLSADAASANWAMALRGTGIRLDQATEAVHGTADLDVDLTATGATTGAVTGSLDGRANLSVTGGDIDNRLLVPLLDAALRAAHVSLDLAGRTSLRCLLLPLTASHGTVSASGMLLDAGRLRVEGEGSADLATETLALQLRPVLRIGAAGLSAPVRVSGTFAHPAAAPASSDGRVGVSIGAPAADPEACGPAPAGSSDKPADKPADLLRRLLR